MEPISQITATVVAYDGDQPGPQDWARYVRDHMQSMYPAAEVDVSYGSANRAYTYPGGEPLDDFDVFCEHLWDLLCDSPDHEQWER